MVSHRSDSAVAAQTTRNFVRSVSSECIAESPRHTHKAVPVILDEVLEPVREERPRSRCSNVAQLHSISAHRRAEGREYALEVVNV